MATYAEAEKAAKAETPIGSELRELDRNIAMCVANVEQIGRQIGDILGPETPMACDENIKLPSRCPLANDLAGYNIRLASLHEALSYMLNRIEL